MNFDSLYALLDGPIDQVKTDLAKVIDNTKYQDIKSHAMTWLGKIYYMNESEFAAWKQNEQ
jgi:hypothetical protein